MPWITSSELVALKVKVAELESLLAAETSRRERAELDLARLNDDFRGLIALTAGRIPPKLAPEFDKDPFAEDETKPVTFLSPDPDEVGITGEEILQHLNDGRLKDDTLSG